MTFYPELIEVTEASGLKSPLGDFLDTEILKL